MQNRCKRQLHGGNVAESRFCCLISISRGNPTMKYINASDLLPPALVQTLQEYVQGGYVYIPAREHKSWGEKSGSREALAQRNEEIRSRKQAGATLEALAETYHLSVSAIRKIIYQKER